MAPAKPGPHITVTGAVSKDLFFPIVVELRHHSCFPILNDG